MIINNALLKEHLNRTNFLLTDFETLKDANEESYTDYCIRINNDNSSNELHGLFNTSDEEYYQFVNSSNINSTSITAVSSFDSCISGNKAFSITKINETASYIYSKTCVTKRDTKHLFNLKERKHNYKIFMPIAYIERVESKLLYKGELKKCRHCCLKVLKSSVKYSVYTIKRKGIVWDTKLKCGYYEKKNFTFKDIHIDKNDMLYIYCETNSSDNLMLFAEISYLRAPRFLMVS